MSLPVNISEHLCEHGTEPSGSTRGVFWPAA